jgi:uncharacterized lipoprotein YajG
MAREIADATRENKARCLQESPDLRPLLETVLQHQSAAVLQMDGRTGDDAADVVQPISTGGQGLGWFKAQIPLC